VEEEQLKRLRTGGMKIPSSYNVMGAADPTNSLNEGEVCAVSLGERTVPMGCALDDASYVLVTKSPGCLSGDVRKLKNVETPALRRLLQVLPSFTYTYT
jgi:hypothetical protein